MIPAENLVGIDDTGLDVLDPGSWSRLFAEGSTVFGAVARRLTGVTLAVTATQALRESPRVATRSVALIGATPTDKARTTSHKSPIVALIPAGRRTLSSLGADDTSASRTKLTNATGNSGGTLVSIDLPTRLWRTNENAACRIVASAPRRACAFAIYWIARSIGFLRAHDICAHKFLLNTLQHGIKDRSRVNAWDDHPSCGRGRANRCQGIARVSACEAQAERQECKDALH